MVALRNARQSDHVVVRVIVELAVGLIGIALLAGALVATRSWLDRHFLPSFFLPRRWYVVLATVVRVVMAALGTWLAIVARPRFGRFAARWPSIVVSTALAAIVALVAGELAIRRVHLRPAEWLQPDEEPLRQPDLQLGWTFVPSRIGQATIGGRTVEYAFDASGYRVRRVDEPVDVEKPAVVFIGESVMFGEGLTWEESVPAQVGALMRTQSANLAVHGFGSDQMYLRLRRELPRFHRPAAVVALFMTTLFGRNLDDDRPHLGAGLAWQPAVQHWRLASLAKIIVPYRSTTTVERGVAMTRDVLRATVHLARARGAEALIVVPQFGREDRAEATLRRRILDEPGLPYVLVEIDSSWHLPWDPHPDARAAHAIAEAIVGRLRGRGV